MAQEQLTSESIIAEYKLQLLQLTQRYEMINSDNISRAHERMNIVHQLENFGLKIDITGNITRK